MKKGSIFMLRARTLTGRHPVLLFLTLLLLIGLLTSCGANNSDNSAAKPTPTNEAAPTKITMTAKDYSFDMPETVQAGLVDIAMNNVGTERHQANVSRLKEGVTKDQVLAAGVCPWLEQKV